MCASRRALASSKYILLVVICTVLTLPSTHAQSCNCPAEYDWVFDFSTTQTWITVKVTIHHSPYDRQLPNFGGGWRFIFPSFTAVDDVQACAADTNQTLNFRVVKNQTATSLLVSFGGNKSDGYAFYVKWLDPEMPRITSDQLEAEWVHEQRLFPGPHPETYHLWLPAGYSAAMVTSSPSSTPETGTQDGRAYITFSAVGQSHNDFSWKLAAKQEALQSVQASQASQGVIVASYRSAPCSRSSVQLVQGEP